jgi:hypothetical protein
VGKTLSTTSGTTTVKTADAEPKKVKILPPKISIKAKQQDKHDDFIISQVEKARNAFDKETLKPVLEQYISEQLKLNRKSWAYTLKPDEIVIKDPEIIVFAINNKAQEVEFNKNREDFTHYLRKLLNNEYITITSELKELENVIVKTIDPNEKFNNMVQENPVMLELKNTFNLEL